MLELEIQRVLGIHCQVICKNVVARWNTMQGIKGNAEIKVADDLPQIVGGLVMATLDAHGMKAWIAEFGSGSLSDTSTNPYLDAYVSTGNFNHYRSKGDMSIRGRDAGAYLDLDGVSHTSTGHSAGKDLELKPVYPVMFPTHVIKETIEAEIPDLIIHLQQTVATYALQSLTMNVDIYI